VTATTKPSIPSTARDGSIGEDQRSLPAESSAPSFPQYASLIARPQGVKAADFSSEGRLVHLITAAQLTPATIDQLSRLADMTRQLSRTRQGINALRAVLSHKRAMLYFTQPSTRTFLSFMAACQILGLTCNEVRDPTTSSEVKRESPLDSIRMFSSYFDVIIMRSPWANFAESCAYLMNELAAAGKRWVPIINGGSGADEHPTQALLDVYTIIRTFGGEGGGPAGKTYCFCGDMGRGRTVRSLCAVLAQYPDTRMIFVSPDHATLRLGDDVLAMLAGYHVEVHQCQSLDASLSGRPLLADVDCLYMTRIQREHNTPDQEQEFGRIDLERFRLTPRRLQQMKPTAAILHPFPRDSVVGEIPVEIDRDPRAMYFRQARNGMWARAALLVHLFGAGDELAALHRDLVGS
jgi:aspartate carbamoyltransferase